MKLYQGKVFNKLNGQLVYKSAWTTSYIEAHEKAEKKCIYSHYRLAVDEK